jgi:hypothetical protein
VVAAYSFREEVVGNEGFMAWLGSALDGGIISTRTGDWGGSLAVGGKDELHHSHICFSGGRVDIRFSVLRVIGSLSFVII